VALDTHARLRSAGNAAAERCCPDALSGMERRYTSMAKIVAKKYTLKKKKR